MKIERIQTVPVYSQRTGEKIESEAKQTFESDAVAFERERHQKRDQKFYTPSEEQFVEDKPLVEEVEKITQPQALQAHGKSVDVVA